MAVGTGPGRQHQRAGVAQRSAGDGALREHAAARCARCTPHAAAPTAQTLTPLAPPPSHTRNSYLVRKAQEEPRRWAGAGGDAAAAEATWQRAVDDLDAFKRQASVYQMYGRKFKTVLVSVAALFVHWAGSRRGSDALCEEQAASLRVRCSAVESRASSTAAHTHLYSPLRTQELDHEALARKAAAAKASS